MSELAPTAQAVCHYIVSRIVDDVESVKVSASPNGKGVVRLDVRVAKNEMGRVIGRRGRVANAIRTVVRAAGTRDDMDILVEFVD